MVVRLSLGCLWACCFGGRGASSSGNSKKRKGSSHDEIETDEFMDSINHHSKQHRLEDDTEYEEEMIESRTQHDNKNSIGTSSSLYYTSSSASSSLLLPLPPSQHHSQIIDSISPIKLNHNVKEYSSEEYKQLWKQYGDMHVTFEYLIIDTKSSEEEYISI